MPQTLAVIYNTSRYLYRFRRELIAAFQESGLRVLALVPDQEYTEKLAKIAVQVLPVRIDSHTLNPFADILTYRDIREQIRINKPHIVFNFTVKPVIYGSIAAKHCGIQEVYSMIPGLGYIFSENKASTVLLRALVLSLYRRALKQNRKVFFQNTSDYLYFLEKRIVTADQGVTVNGSGVDLDTYSSSARWDESPTILMASRLLRHKGVYEFIDAARAINGAGMSARFVLAGSLDTSPAKIEPEYLNKVIDDGVIEYVGELEDVRPWIERAWAVVLPSYYREGMPRILLEAMAMGRPVITTDLPGCRDVVAMGENGYLVKPRSVDSLVDAIRRLIEHPHRVEKFGKASRKIAEERFDVVNVTERIVTEMGRAKIPLNHVTS